MSSSRWCSCCFYRFARCGDIQSHCKFPVTIIGIISIISMCYYHPLHTSALNVLFFNQFLCFLRILMSLLGHFAMFNTLSYSLQVLLSGKLLNFRRQSHFVTHFCYLLTCILGGDTIAGGCVLCIANVAAYSIWLSVVISMMPIGRIRITYRC